MRGGQGEINPEEEGEEASVEIVGGVPNGFVNHLTPVLDRIIIPFSGEVRVAA